ncbi:hypothetical protein A1O1_01680 [Capronia coronata CBS 617.96]|uniref:DNA endonuclease activator Ctp1 C-terminal domain-containing protein n=1 Tax=Capronia coronata CBS 617.96 TaxID=1182541 RepID=W9YL38_9EURO|nr:uncharacterized protein A1O1_01680 [Capronia coronata CBS 617.96]EXJ93288.1 hypothetical protein A1O1_01680 [Capronia coronata CBS 617.96]
MSTPQSLTDTLILALSQSNDLQRRTRETIETIERLKRENEKLKRQVEELSRARKDEPRDLSPQLDHLFRQDAEKQAEIDQLKSKLRLIQAKERKWRLQNPCVSSPIVFSNELDATTPASASRKRPRSKTPDEQRPLREISANVAAPNRLPRSKRFGDRGAHAITSIAEDGEDHNRSQSDTSTENTPQKAKASSPNNRLQALLAAPAPVTPLLPRPTPSASIQRTVASKAEEEAPIQLQIPGVGNLARDGSASFRRPPLLPAQPSAPEDEEPFRSRPVNRLNLSHFKVNPTYTGGCDYAYDEAIRGREARKCLAGCTRPECCGNKFKALAATLPADTDISEDDLLLEFLGPGSEEKIRTLTPMAKENLVFEARTTRLANLYGKMHKTLFDRPESPPGYWDTDMPGTQEEQEYRERARRREREEVVRRYEAAMKGDGRWLFADE